MRNARTRDGIAASERCVHLAGLDIFPSLFHRTVHEIDDDTAFFNCEICKILRENIFKNYS